MGAASRRYRDPQVAPASHPSRNLSSLSERNPLTLFGPVLADQVGRHKHFLGADASQLGTIPAQIVLSDRLLGAHDAGSATPEIGGSRGSAAGAGRARVPGAAGGADRRATTVQSGALTYSGLSRIPDP